MNVVPFSSTLLRVVVRPAHVTSALLFVLTGSAAASPITTFTGQDDGVAASGPFPASTAASNQLRTAASSFGGVGTITFEGLALGVPTALTVAPGVTVTQTGVNLGAGLSGVSNVALLTNIDGFNTTAGGSYFLGTSDEATTFNFASATHSFGFFETGLQTAFSTGVSISFNDGTSQVVNFSNVNVNGGVEYFGFTDGTAFNAVTISNLTPPGSVDYVGIDDVTYNTAASTAVTPEPSSLICWEVVSWGWLVLLVAGISVRTDSLRKTALPAAHTMERERVSPVNVAAGSALYVLEEMPSSLSWLSAHQMPPAICAAPMTRVSAGR